MSVSHNPPPGWYPDPAGQAGSRYWDGVKWTTHTQPAPTSAAPVTPAVPPPPTSRAVPPPPPAAPVAPVVPVATGKGANAFVEGLKRLEPFPLIVVGAVLFFISTFLPWAENAVDSVNAWEGDAAWLIFGISTREVAQGGGSGNTDLILLLPLAIIAVAVAAMMRQGKTISYGREISVGAASLLTLLLIAEVVHINGVVDELETDFGFGNVSGGPAWGLFAAIVAAGVMTFGAVRALLTSRRR
jgi:hypothetical protein